MYQQYIQRIFLHNISATLLRGTLIASAMVLASCGAGSGEGLDISGQPINEDNGGNNPQDPYAKVQAIFDARCTVCHAGSAAPQGLVLTKEASYSAIVDVASTQQSDKVLIKANDPDASYLVQKIIGSAGISGAQMPRNGPPFLSTEQIATIVDWVNAGAPAPIAADPNAEFIAELSDLTNYPNWRSVDYTIGATNIVLGSAHAGDKDSFSRRVFANDKALASTGETFANGSIFVKEIVSFESGSKVFADQTGLLAMVKRGNDFNPQYGGWEWLVLNPDLSEISLRGGDIMENGCNACHTQADMDTAGSIIGGNDFVFMHMSEFIAQQQDFSDYKNWSVIDDRSDNNPLLDNMAHGADKTGTSRKVYKKQLYANPNTTTQGYPIGTILLKEVTQDNTVIELTAMVKRGGGFNPDNGSWEWFMLNPETLAIALDNNNNPARGANLMNGMCNGCHLSANPTSGHGTDLVFKHDGDPFNNNQAFFAELSDFTNYANWDLVDYTIGAAVPGIGGGHQGQNDRFARKVFANPVAMQADGERFPKGAIFVKEVISYEGNNKNFSPQLGLIAMAKRGSNFNTEHNGWEWFELENDVSGIIGRGGDYRNNGCNGCHAQVKTGTEGFDYVFNHPSEYTASNSDFSDYQNWLLIDERSDTNNLLGGMAHGADKSNTVRRVFKKQHFAKALADDIGYPIATTIIKEVKQNDVVIELAAMVKRGGDFNPDHNHWEWFMLDPVSTEIAQDPQAGEMRGADLMGGMCNTCHKLAEDDMAVGLDYVFIHNDDPVNNNK